MKIYMLRYTKSDGGDKMDEYHKYTYGGSESTKHPHQAWQTGSMERAVKKMDDLNRFGNCAEIVTFSED